MDSMFTNLDDGVQITTVAALNDFIVPWVKMVVRGNQYGSPRSPEQ